MIPCQDAERITRHGLMEFLQHQGLEEHLDLVEEWCAEMGAAFMEELRENFAEVVDMLQLSDFDRVQFVAPPLDTVYQVQVC